MARPIPDIDLRELSKLQKELKSKESKSIFEKVARSKSSNNIILGTISGWVTGVGVIKIGKIAAFGLGGSVILLHFASEFGYVHINWDRIKEATAHSHIWMDNVTQFVKKNSCFSVGFLGGFFFGIACT